MGPPAPKRATGDELTQKRSMGGWAGLGQPWHWFSFSSDRCWVPRLGLPAWFWIMPHGISAWLISLLGGMPYFWEEDYS